VDLAALPATPATLGAYLTAAVTDPAGPTYVPATLARWVAAVNFTHRRAGHPAPAEVPFTAFISRRTADHISGRLIVRRVKRLNPTAKTATSVAGGDRQGELFAIYRYHAVFTDSPLTLVQCGGLRPADVRRGRAVRGAGRLRRQHGVSCIATSFESSGSPSMDVDQLPGSGSRS
jgi:hypothetical protein